MSKIKEATEIADELYEYAIVNKNDFVKEKSRQLMRYLDLISTLGNNLHDTNEDYSDEIVKVKRKVPKWMKKTDQYNYLILKAFMDISDNNEHRVSVDELEEYVDIGKAFLANYNNLKTISAKNHGKVFDEINREIELWEPVSEFIEELFSYDLKDKKTNNVLSYKFNGKVYKKNNKTGASLQNLLFDIFQQFLKDYTNKSYRELQVIFNPLHKNFSSEGNSKKVIFNEVDANKWLKDSKDKSIDRRYFEPVRYNGENIYFTTEWGDTNGDITNFIDFARIDLGFNIDEI
ncbi:hypothetical protein MNB_SV-3-765 [hydrothermal vent metagenome]|uniref:Uncharacterized protein n=1 Tax=hydrothermal vent metagenome TaxID=652676 RepID=A0A1W1CWV8_9ZZZZ